MSVPGTHSKPRVSIHAPAKGATRDRVIVGLGRFVSIHAPAKGATGLLHAFAHSATCFNPRPREGGDSGRMSSRKPPVGFNPRPREGGDLSLASQSLGRDVSIHAPAKGATG